MDNNEQTEKDAVTETSHINVSASATTFSTVSVETQENLADIRRFTEPQQRNAETETDFPIVTSLTITYTSTTDLEDEFSAESKEEVTTSGQDSSHILSSESTKSTQEETISKLQRFTNRSACRDDLKSEDQAFTLKPSKSHHVKYSSSSEDLPLQNTKFSLKGTKSQHGRKKKSSSDEDRNAMTDSNLQKGNVFVYMVIPPDGGYGWFIMFISFLCQVVVDGIIFGIGVILPHIAQEFGIPGSKVVLVASMQIGFYFLAGTISSAFINKYGFRPVALAGCLLSIIVLTIATFSTNLSMMLLFYSILGGPGLSMIWVSSQLIIGYYFEKYRPIANGLSCSGAGVGIMMFAYMNNILVTKLGWRNLMRVHIIFLVLVLIMGLTYVEVAPTRIGRVKEAVVDDTDSESWDLFTDITRYSRYSVKVDDSCYSLDEGFETILEKLEETPPSPPHKADCCERFTKFCCPCLLEYLERRREEQAQLAATKRYVIHQDLMERQDLFYTGTAALRRPAIVEHRKTISFGETDVRTISLDDIDHNLDPRTVAQRLSSMHVKTQLQDKRKTYHELKATQKFPLFAYLRPENLIHYKIRNGFHMLFDFRLLAIMEFRILFVSAFLFPMGFNIPFVYSTVRVQIEPSFAKLISPSIGFSNFAFRIASGFVAYRFREYTTYICGGGMVFGGVAVFMSAFYGLDVVWFQFVYAICYGIAPAFYSTLRAIIYVRSLGLDKLTNAFGLTALAMGMGVFIGTTAGGILNDLTGDYTASFAFAGICITVAGTLKLVLPYLTAKAAKN